MELEEVMRTQSTCRYFTDKEVAPEILHHILDSARFAPQGGNRQPVRLVVVRDAALRERLAGMYLDLWRPYYAGLTSGRGRASSLPPSVVGADHFARNLKNVPVLIVVCARRVLHKRDEGADRSSMIDGASIYPAVQNVLLAARNEGVGSAITTLLARRDAQVRDLLGIPETYQTAAVLALGWPARRFPTKLNRIPVEEFAYADRFEVPFPGGSEVADVPKPFETGC